MSKFTASNGVSVEYEEITDRVDFTGLKPSAPMWFGEGEFQALREFFQHERDEELGRWRWPENPNYVVYLDRGDALVVDERDPRHSPDRISRRYLDDPTGTLGWGEFAARDYFEAHPERKPWHDAKTGEVWVITVVGEESAWTVNNKGQFENPDSTYELTNPHITAARRIWPVSND